MNSMASQSSNSGCVGGDALRAEVVLRLDEAAAEILLPDAIHDDARGERILRLDEPAREIEAVRVSAGLERRQHGGRAGRDALAGRVKSPLMKTCARAASAAPASRASMRPWARVARAGRDSLVRDLKSASSGRERAHTIARFAPASASSHGASTAARSWSARSLARCSRSSFASIPRRARLRLEVAASLLAERAIDLVGDSWHRACRRRTPACRRRGASPWPSLDRVVEEGEEPVVLLAARSGRTCGRGTARSRPSGRATTVPVVLTRSITASMRNCSGSMPPSWLICVLRLKPVAIFCVDRGVRQQVAGELLDGELIERHVAVQRGDRPSRGTSKSDAAHRC